jgi:hypothetical protein
MRITTILRSLLLTTLALLVSVPALAVQTVVQAKGFTNDNVGTSVTVSFNTTPSVGNAVRLILAHFGGNITTVTDNQGGGNSYAVDVSGSNPNSASTRATIISCNNIATASGTFTVTITTTAGDYLVGALIEESGSLTVSPLDKSGEADTGFTPATSVTPTTTVSTTQANEIVYAVASSGNNGSNPHGFALPGGYTQDYKEDNTSVHMGGIIGHKVVSATGIQNPTITWTAADDGVGLVATYKATGGGGGGTVVNPLSGRGGSAARPIN